MTNCVKIIYNGYYTYIYKQINTELEFISMLICSKLNCRGIKRPSFSSDKKIRKHTFRFFLN